MYAMVLKRSVFLEGKNISSKRVLAILVRRNRGLSYGQKSASFLDEYEEKQRKKFDISNRFGEPQKVHKPSKVSKIKLYADNKAVLLGTRHRRYHPTE